MCSASIAHETPEKKTLPSLFLFGIKIKKEWNIPRVTRAEQKKNEKYIYHIDNKKKKVELRINHFEFVSHFGDVKASAAWAWVGGERAWNFPCKFTHNNSAAPMLCEGNFFFFTLLFLLVFWWLKTGNVRVHFLYFFFIYVDARRQRASGTPFRLRYAALIYDQSFMVLRDCACVNKSTCRMTLA